MNIMDDNKTYELHRRVEEMDKFNEAVAIVERMEVRARNDGILEEKTLDKVFVVSFETAKVLKHACDKYRAICESLEKRIARYRDVASSPDIHTAERNKDSYRTLMDAKSGYESYCESLADTASKLPFDEWLFAETTSKREDL